jgi:hypothetical protein
MSWWLRLTARESISALYGTAEAVPFHGDLSRPIDGKEVKIPAQAKRGLERGTQFIGFELTERAAGRLCSKPQGGGKFIRY